MDFIIEVLHEEVIAGVSLLEITGGVGNSCVDQAYCNEDCGSNCMENCGTNCGKNCIVNCDSNCNSNCNSNCVVNCGSNCIANGGTIICGSLCAKNFVWGVQAHLPRIHFPFLTGLTGRSLISKVSHNPLSSTSIRKE